MWIDSQGKVIAKKKARDRFDIMVDGGFTANFPIHMFDVSGDTTAHPISNPSTVGLRIDTPEQIKQDRTMSGLAPARVHSFRTYIGASYTYVLENLNRQELTEADWQRTVSISCGSIGPKIRSLSLKEKHILVTNGQEAMRGFLEARSQRK